MSSEQTPPRDVADRDQNRPAESSRSPLAVTPLPALVVLLIPLIVVPIAALFTVISAEDDGQLPYWAIEAFGTELLSSALAAATLPWPILLLYGLIPLFGPPIAALIGLGTVGRWAALGGFCLVGAGLWMLLDLGVLLELIAPESHGIAVRLGSLAGLTWPLLALEACGCLLASSVAPARFDRAVETLDTRRDRSTRV